MKLGWKKYLNYSIAVLVVGGLVLFLILLGYSYSATGFGDFTNPNGEFVRGKTLWDWMELLIIPIVLAGGAIFLNRSERNTEREVAADRQQEAALQTYFDRMSELLLKEKLRTTQKKEVRDVARTRTLSVLRLMDTKRNNLIFQFLREAELVVDGNSIFILASMVGMDLQNVDLRFMNLVRADLRGANLVGANLEGADLQGANLAYANLGDARLVGANLVGANLVDVNLRGAKFLNANLQSAYLAGANLQYVSCRGVDLLGTDLQYANLRGADLVGANLGYANLEYANLEDANLGDANLVDANLQNVNLRGAKFLTQEQLTIVKSLKNATMPDGTKHE